MATVNGLTKEEQEKRERSLALNQKLVTPGVELSNREFKAVLENFKDEITAALPVHLKENADKYARQALSLFTQNPKLKQCTGITIVTALMTATGLGLDLTPQLGQCYIIPYETRKRDGKAWTTVMEAQFQLGYRGAIALAQRSGELTRITAEAVYEKDYFKWSKGLNPVLEHEPSEAEDPGPMKYVYAVANFKNGGYAFEVWPVGKIIAHAKKFSKSYYRKDYRTGQMVENDKSPWHTNFESMAKKTLIMAIWKYLPLSTELLLAGENDESVKRDFGDIQEEKDVIMLASAPVEEEPEPVLVETGEPAGEPEPEETPSLQPEHEPEEKLIAEAEELFAALDWQLSEKAEFLYNLTRKTELRELPMGPLSKVVAELKARVSKLDEAAR
ncbi:MAG: recombinase RecT [Fretibacterium sp.]|nr:recombinase RecT [Fretibacterium sp.]